MPIRTDLTKFGAELRRWRRRSSLSQLDLANQATVSQRHISFLETGRSRPSPEMVEHLCIVLDVPLRARNALLNAAGFADAYTEEPFDGPALSNVRDGLEKLVEAHEPYPAYVIDRCWNLLMANTAATHLTGALVPTDMAMDLAGNVIHLFLHPDGARGSVANWSEVAAVLIDRLWAECTADPTDTVLADLYDEVMAYPGVAELAAGTAPKTGAGFITEIHFKTDDLELRFYTAISSLAAANDITLSELRLETLLPADAATTAALHDDGVRAVLGL